MHQGYSVVPRYLLYPSIVFDIYLSLVDELNAHAERSTAISSPATEMAIPPLAQKEKKNNNNQLTPNDYTEHPSDRVMPKVMHKGNLANTKRKGKISSLSSTITLLTNKEKKDEQITQKTMLQLISSDELDGVTVALSSVCKSLPRNELCLTRTVS
ncbi:uncharacterized protein TM35_000131850 [Trypanosoma theileri]|uniref:Uncharacterized protein n=1 Tax=Trypanosoma theileri TaxID=67003 RepID=A0A1X0NX38_9TRYP|nr:uncharacterized protein TM35_000131850 [Trypanosoma theileri]ORC89181.1 hypothetical protein TM35_000131850 [Trypanosoma theileri]